jgi:hypothetical protein
VAAFFISAHDPESQQGHVLKKDALIAQKTMDNFFREVQCEPVI